MEIRPPGMKRGGLWNRAVRFDDHLPLQPETVDTSELISIHSRAPHFYLNPNLLRFNEGEFRSGGGDRTRKTGLENNGYPSRYAASGRVKHFGNVAGTPKALTKYLKLRWIGEETEAERATVLLHKRWPTLAIIVAPKTH